MVVLIAGFLVYSVAAFVGAVRVARNLRTHIGYGLCLIASIPFFTLGWGWLCLNVLL
jgi:hypothetical protein